MNHEMTLVYSIFTEQTHIIELGGGLLSSRGLECLLHEEVARLEQSDHALPHGQRELLGQLVQVNGQAVKQCEVRRHVTRHEAEVLQQQTADVLRETD